MAGRTPALDKLAAEGMMFTDYYAEASCTAGRANFITGELPIRTGMTTVGQAGSPIGIFSGLDWFPTFAAAAGDPNVAQELLQGKDFGRTTYKVHLDGYDQTPVLTGKGPSNRHEIF